VGYATPGKTEALNIRLCSSRGVNALAVFSDNDLATAQ